MEITFMTSSGKCLSKRIPKRWIFSIKIKDFCSMKQTISKMTEQNGQSYLLRSKTQEAGLSGLYKVLLKPREKKGWKYDKMSQIRGNSKKETLKHRNLRSNNGNNNEKSLYVPRNLDNTKSGQRCGDAGTTSITGGNKGCAAVPQARRHVGTGMWHTIMLPCIGTGEELWASPIKDM